jgi:GxxExxY protein
MPEKIIYKELSYKLVGCFYDVYNELGPGHKEQIYHKALALEFKSKDISLDDKKRLKVKYKGQEIGIYQPDFVIEDKIIVEIKSLLQMPNVSEKQLYYYLRGADYKLGYLVNFGAEKLDIRRRVYDTARVNSR